MPTKRKSLFVGGSSKKPRRGSTRIKHKRTFDFLALPRELRDGIYVEAAKIEPKKHKIEFSRYRRFKDYTHVVGPDGLRRKVPRHTVAFHGHGLLYTCKQTQVEYSKIMYSTVAKYIVLHITPQNTDDATLQSPNHRYWHISPLINDFVTHCKIDTMWHRTIKEFFTSAPTTSTKKIKATLSQFQSLTCIVLDTGNIRYRPIDPKSIDTRFKAVFHTCNKLPKMRKMLFTTNRSHNEKWQGNLEKEANGGGWTVQVRYRNKEYLGGQVINREHNIYDYSYTLDDGE
ncbi:hypothetical protein EJ08DRAFT_647698 [Tothia fuscella]|uniref:Uncharacterized protein n=1 Tax=Tothia fuscella TaxID=1048955 RepID=A0A9P4NWK2_9PEZI|nr:hypothetical protein EJ08DRAFT_647698 [Tothia fuscella]